MSRLLVKSCPYCSSRDLQRRGFYKVKILNTWKRRYFCKSCLRSSSSQTLAPTFRQKRPHLNDKILILLTNGLPQRAIARVLKCNKNTVDQKVKWLGIQDDLKPKYRTNVKTLFIDEMESIESTKLRPLTIPLAVTDEYQILSATVGRIPAKGHLSRYSIKKYGRRKNERFETLERLFLDIKAKLTEDPHIIKTDGSKIYRRLIRRHFPSSLHETFISRERIKKIKELLFQNEQKKVFDPLFPLNQRCAKLRADIKRLTRRSWCTTKKPANLELILKLYIHNQ